MKVNSSFIYDFIKSNAPFAIGKIGMNELRTLRCRILNIKKLEERSNYYLYVNNGVFPQSEKAVLDFVKVMIETIPFMDALPFWAVNGPLIDFEKQWIPKVAPKCKIIEVKNYEPYYSDNPWSQHLEGKKVLVISPFTDSIIKQYQKRNLLWQDQRVLPDFELKTLKHQNSPALGVPSIYDNWIEMLEDLKRKIELIDFDIALIGTGASSLPLAVHCKKIGKQAIHLGGALQILFGIKGKRWDNKPHISCFYNEHWIRLSDEEIPKDYKLMEDGCYW